MSEITRVSLFGKLNSLAYKAIESATVFCKLRGNPYVELVHWFNQILQLPDSDLHHIVREFGIEPSRLARDMTAALDQLPRGATSISDLSSHMEEAVERGWVYGTLLFGESQVRTGHLVVGILKTPGLRNSLSAMSREFDKVKVEQLTDRWGAIVKGSPEETMSASDGFQTGGGASPGEASGAMAPAAMGKQEALRKYSVDLTERARSGEMDPIVGRDEEIRQIVDILMRRRQNNPILTGEAGVGKTAVVEGFAQRIASGDVPPPLKGVSLRSLDIGLLQAGASMKGEFENRLRQVIDEVQSSATTHHPVHRRGPHLDRGRRRRRHRRRGQPAQAGPGARQTAHHRGHHLGRVQEAHREGSGAHPAIPGGAGGRARRDQGPAHDARDGVRAGEAPSGSRAGRSAGGGGQAVPPLHPGPPVARQGGQSARHLLCPGGDQPACGAARGRGQPPPYPGARNRDRRSSVERWLSGSAAPPAREKDVQEKLEAEKQRLAGLEERWAAEKKLVDQILELRAKLRGRPMPQCGRASQLAGRAAQRRTGRRWPSCKASNP